MESVYQLIMGVETREWRKKAPDFDGAAVIEKINGILPMPGAYDVSCPWGVALAKLKTLARQPHSGWAEDERVKEALWYCIGAAAFPADKTRTRTRLDEAVKKVMAMTHGVPPREREALRRRLGETAAAMAKLIYYSIMICEEGRNI